MGTEPEAQGGLVARPALIYYMDASIQLPVARALAFVRDGILYPGSPGCPVRSPAMRDIAWLPIAGQGDWVIVLRDKHIRTRTRERELLLAHGLRAFCLTHAGNYTRWQTLDLLVRRWPDMEKTAKERPGPYIYSVTHSGPRRVA